jgi:hypothetical protein
MRLSTEAWNRAMGKLVIDLSDEHPFNTNKSDVPEKSTTVTSYHAVSNKSKGDRVEFLSGNRLVRERSKGDIGKQGIFQALSSIISH